MTGEAQLAPRTGGESGPEPAVVVTGASAGIGRAIARVAAGEGRAIVLVARSAEGLRDAAEEVRAAGGRPLVLPLDVGADDAPARLDAFLAEHGLVCDVLVNSAGIGLRGHSAVLPLDDQMALLKLNIDALSRLTLHVLPEMIARRGGGVVNLGSVASFLPGPHMAAYYASKSFVYSFSAALHREAAPWNVTVTCVAPGPVSSRFLQLSRLDTARLFRILPHKDPDFVAERAWRGFRAGRRLVVPGLSLRLVATLVRLVPDGLLLRGVDKLQRSGNDPCPCGSGKSFKQCCGRRGGGG